MKNELWKIGISFFLCCMIMIARAQSQGLTVAGTVTDERGESVIGATVKVKGEDGVGCITDLDGHYTLSVSNPKATLVFSFMGMRTEEVPVKGRKQIDVTLYEDSKMLDEVVVVGYGTVKRKDLTGSVVSVKGDELMDVPTSSVAEALMGRQAGVMITQTEGGPNGSISVQIRGGMSITQSNEPLYIIDGFPSDGGLGDLDPSEIESIDVLKDASSTAIYGARGANGVVVVTTKRGAKDNSKISVTFDSYVGFGKLARKLDVLPVDEFVLADYEREAGRGITSIQSFQNRYGSFLEIEKNYGNYDGIDWQEEALGRTTIRQNYRMNISGGAKDFKYSLNYNYYKDMGAMVFSGTHKHSISFNFSHRPAQSRIALTGRVSYMQDKTEGIGTSSNNTRFNKMEHILRYRPTMGIFGDDNELLLHGDNLTDSDSNPIQSPLVSAAEERTSTENRSFQANGGLTFRLTDWLSFQNTTGIRHQLRRNNSFNGENSSSAKRSSINGSIQYQENATFQTSNVLTYTLDKDPHSFSAMLGQEWVYRWTRRLRATANNFPNSDIGLGDMSLGTPSSITSNENYDDKLLSFFTRFNYNWADKYLVTATLRADGSSKFSANHKWGIFPSVSAAWRILEEDFMQPATAVFSDFKLRIGYGMAGNNSAGSYSSLALLESIRYSQDDANANGYVLSRIPSEDLRWEANTTFNVGLDMGFFDQRLTLMPEFFLNRSHDLLLDANIPASSGFTSIMCNIGKTQNMGLDLGIRSVNIQKKGMNWTTDLNFSFYKNKVKALAGESYFYEDANFGLNTQTHKIEVGKPLGQFYGYRTLGLYQVEDFDYDPSTKTYTLKKDVPGRNNETVRPGMWKYEDLDGNGVINENDRTVIGNANHKFYGGLNNRLKIKDFDLSVFLTFAYGGQVLNATKLRTSVVGERNYNALNVTNSANRWMSIDAFGQEVTDPQELAELNKGKTVAAYYDMENGDVRVHSWAIEDASYLRVSNVTVGYTFPRKLLKKVGLKKLRMYVTGNNLFVWTPYTGYDPEVSTRRNAQLTPGVDYAAYPRSRTFVIGLSAGF